MRGRALTYRPILASLIAAALTGGCVTGSLQEFDQTLKADDSHRLYEPLAATPQTVLEQLAEIELEPTVVFLLSQHGIQRAYETPPQEAYWDEDKAVFFRPVTEGEDDAAWLFFNNHKLRMEAVVDPMPMDGDLVSTGEGTFSIYRSVPVRKGGVRLHGDLELYRFDFQLTDEGDLEAGDFQRLTRENGADLQPVPIYGTERVVYVHHPEGEPRELRLADPDGGPPRPLFDDQDFDVLFPTMLSDGRLAFVADVLGYYALYQVEEAVQYVRELETMRYEHVDTRRQFLFDEVARPFVYPFPKSEHKGRRILASMGEDGKLLPVLEHLPAELDLRAIADLVEAHNPWVNQRRTAYAAALLNAAQFKLRNWPSLDLGLSYDHAVEVFDNMPLLFTGDTITKEILRVMVGMTQPLLDFRENNALKRSALADAEIERNLLDKEINGRITEASELYFEAVYLAERIAIEDAQLAINAKREQYYRALRTQNEAIRLPLMATEQVREGILSERGFDVDRLAFLKTRLAEVMGLPHDTEILLAHDKFDLDRYVLPSLEEMIHRAQLNHPSVKAAENALTTAFWTQVAGPEIRPRASAAAYYEHRERAFQRSGLSAAQSALVPGSVHDEIAGGALSMEIPFASKKANRLHKKMWADLTHSLRLIRDAETRAVKTGMEEAYMDFAVAQRDLRAKRASESYFLEKLRVSRLYEEFGPPATSVALLRPVDEPGATSDSLGTGVLAPLSAEFEYLRAMDKSLRVEKDLGLRFAKVWREMGIIDRLLDDAEEYERVQHGRSRASTWVWVTREHLASDDALDAFIEDLRARGTRRIYAYLYSASDLLGSRHDRERMTLLTELCARYNIEVWALLGEPEWIETRDTRAVDRALRSVLAFNAQFGSFEPRIRGVKLDLEPHSLPGWEDDADRRALLEENYRSLLATARRSLNGALPLWADLPTKFFREDEAALVASLQELLDGATLMSYFDDEASIKKWSGVALDAFQKPLEIGVEFSESAPESDSIFGWSASRRSAFIASLYEQFGHHEHYAGTAFHDYKALAAETTRD